MHDLDLNPCRLEPLRKIFIARSPLSLHFTDMRFALIFMVVQFLTFPTDPKLVPIGLAAAHRNVQIPRDHDFFGPLVGDWNVKSSVYKKDGTLSEWEGIWSFRWILNGSAIADVLSAKEQNPDRLLLAAIGLRSYDPTNQTWRMVNFEPFSNTIQELRVVRVAGKLIEPVLGSDPVETWTFENISPTSFYWVDRYAERTGNTRRARNIRNSYSLVSFRIQGQDSVFNAAIISCGCRGTAVKLLTGLDMYQ